MSDTPYPPPLEPGEPGYDPVLDGDSFHGVVGWYDRRGEPITIRQWSYLKETIGEPYFRIAADYLDDGHIWVSTVWLGLDHSFLGGPPLIFETMVFVGMTEEQLAERRKRWLLIRDPADFPWEDLDTRRYATEEQARDGHREIVESLTLRIEALNDVTD